jgi:hypothetical protein
MTDSIRHAALVYVARGWSVIPIERHGKRPLVPWLEFQSRLAAADEIEDWFQRWPDANIALVTGRFSGLVVLDVDSSHGGSASLSQLEIENGPLPRTVEAVTGGGGRHLYFSHPGMAVANRVGLRPGIDVRGDGGCVVAPPSVHSTGNRYAWVRARSPGEIRLADLPRWLLHPEGERPGHPLSHWRKIVQEGVDEGARNATLASLTGHLLWHGVDPQVALELLLAWNRVRCRPPLDDEEVANVVDSITRLHLREHETAP